jgi:hypothetical protein
LAFNLEKNFNCFDDDALANGLANLLEKVPKKKG